MTLKLVDKIYFIINLICAKNQITLEMTDVYEFGKQLKNSLFGFILL